MTAQTLQFSLKLLRGEIQEISMPERARPVHFAFQNDLPWLWAIADMSEPPRSRRFVIVGTADELPEFARHVDSTDLAGHAWHLYAIYWP